jgi:ribosome maturation factor RimP
MKIKIIAGSTRPGRFNIQPAEWFFSIAKESKDATFELVDLEKINLPLLDEKNTIEQSYVLEISSPGLDRVIKKNKDFVRFSGKLVKLKLKIAENGQRRFSGLLKGLNGEAVVLQVGDQVKEFPLRNIDEVRLDDAAQVNFGGN